MKAVMLAGGKGTRLHPLTLEIPKPLITIKKKPLINYTLGLFGRYAVDDVKIIIHPEDQKDYERWKGEYAGEFAKMNIEIVEESQPMGTLGFIFHELRDWMDDDDIFVTNADDIKDIDLSAMLAFHRASGLPATVALMHMEKPEDYGAVLVSEHKVKDFLEKRVGLPPGLVSAGMYVISAGALAHNEDEIPAEKKFLMFEKDLFPTLAKTDKLGAFVAQGKFYDCGTFERWEQAIREA